MFPFPAVFTMNMVDWIFLVGVTVTLVGAAVAYIGFLAWIRRRWTHASAVILRYRITRSDDKEHGQAFFHPVVRFTTSEGRVVTVVSSFGSWRRPWPRGAKVNVRYNPTDPQCAEIQCFGSTWLLPLTVMGLVVWIWTLLIYFGLWRS